MYTLQGEACFDSAHFLRDHGGKCENLHGHRWRVVADFVGEHLQEEGAERGMLLDFSRIKEGLAALCQTLDHRLLIEDGSLKPETIAALTGEGFSLLQFAFRPTAENLARYLYKELEATGLPVGRVTVYETPNSAAAYQEKTL